MAVDVVVVEVVALRLDPLVVDVSSVDMVHARMERRFEFGGVYYELEHTELVWTDASRVPTAVLIAAAWQERALV